MSPLEKHRTRSTLGAWGVLLVSMGIFGAALLLTVGPALAACASGACADAEVEANQGPQADYAWSANTTWTVFEDRSGDPDGAVVAWHWDFGDGNTSDERHPRHAFAEGTHQVVLTVTDDGGLTDDHVQEVDVPQQAADEDDAEDPADGQEGKADGGEDAPQDQNATDDTEGQNTTDDGQNATDSDDEDADDPDAAEGQNETDTEAPDGTSSSGSTSDGTGGTGGTGGTDGGQGGTDATGGTSGSAAGAGRSGTSRGDADGDGVADRHDVCPTVADPDQADHDGDGVGDACDGQEPAAEDEETMGQAPDDIPPRQDPPASDRGLGEAAPLDGQYETVWPDRPERQAPGAPWWMAILGASAVVLPGLVAQCWRLAGHVRRQDGRSG